MKTAAREANPQPPASASAQRRCSRLTAGLLAAAFLLGLVAHLAGLAGLRGPSHDDAIAYLSATGHQGEYAQITDGGLPPVGQRAPAAEWQRLWRVEDRLVYTRIAADLAAHDIHPPAYFWLLHTWLLATGVHVWAGPALNVLIHLAAGAALFRLGCLVVRDALPVAVATVLWAASPAVVGSAVVARPYSLLALLAVLLADQTLRLTERDGRPRPARALALAAIAAVGLLTQLQFAVVVGVAGTWLVIRLPRHRARLAAVLGALAAGALLARAALPGLAAMLARQQGQAEQLTAQEFRLRLLVALRAPGRFLLAEPSHRVAVALTAVVVASAVVAAVRARRGRDPARLGVVWFAAATLAALTGAYLMAFTPRAALEPRYLSVVWPFAALLPALAWPWTRRHGRAVLAAALVAAIIAPMWVLSLARLADPGAPGAHAALEGADLVVVDNLRRGVLPRLLWPVSGETAVLASDQGSLAAGDWLPQPGARGVYLSSLEYGPTAAGREEVLAVLAEHGRVRRVPGGIWGYGEVYAFIVGD